MLIQRLPLVVIAAAVAALAAGCPTPPAEGEGEEGEGDVVAEGEGDVAEGEGDGGGEGEGEDFGAEGVFSVEECAGAPAGGGANVCAVTPGSGGTIVFGAVLTPGKVFEGGAVAYDDDGAITCVGCNCAATSAGFTQIACGDAAISPGLINAHDHAGWMNDQPWYLTGANSGIRDSERWEQRNDWRKGKRGHDDISAPGQANADAKALGEFRFALSGATATLASGGFSDAGGVIRNLDDGGDMGDLGLSSVKYVTFPLGDSNGAQLASGCAYPNIAAKPSGPNAPHVSEGVDKEANNEFQCLTSAANGGKDVLDDNAAIIHGAGLTPADVGVMAERGVSLIWSPRSNISLYGDTAPVTVMKALGVNIALGTDWLPSGSMNMSRELACVIGLNDDHYGQTFSREEIWRMVTVNAARATHADAAIGSFVVGHRADIAVFARHGGPFSSVVEASSEDMALVLKSGRPLAGNAAVVTALDNTCESITLCGVDKALCATREAGKALAALQAAANGSHYALASCAGETPIEEPTCVPARTETIDAIDGSTLYDGIDDADDNDGDGVANANDDCPNVFNPIRPLDNGAQANADADGLGDACDPCPLDADTTTCSTFNPNDRDGDGVDAPPDNCPDDSNADQLDRDTDGKGDVCDLCPDAANPGDQGCPVSVVDVKTDPAISAANSRVHVEDLVVTALASNGFWAQLNPASPAYPGVNHTCIFGFVGAGTKPALGDEISVDGTATVFFQQIQLNQLTFTVTGSGTVDPTVIEDGNLADVAALGAGTPLEGCLIEVANAAVTDPAPPAGGGDAGNPRNEFAIQGGVRVDDLLFLIDPQPQLDERFAFIRGPLAFRNSLLKLLPRDENDVAFGNVEVSGFVDDTVFARIGATQPAGLGALTVRLTRTPGADTVVTLASSDNTKATVPATVTVLAGQTTAVVPVTGVAAGTTTITATLETSTATATVTVVADDAVASAAAITPSDVTVVINRSQVFTVDLDVPAPTAGSTLTVDITGNVGTVVPATIAIPANATSVSFTLTAAAAASTGSVTATAGTSDVSANVNLIELAPLGLVINEIDYDQQSADTAEFVEIFNGSAAAVDVSGFDLVFINGANKTAYRTATLAGSIPPNGYLVVGADTVLNAITGSAVLKVTLGGSIENGAPDGAILFDSADAVVDGIAYEGSIAGIALRDLTIDLTGDRATTAADLNDAPGSVCRNPTTGAWTFCPAPSAGLANTP